jgi:uncharacterized protein
MSTLRERVEDFLSQPRIAVAGVARDGTKIGNAIYKRFRDAGFKVYPVNPNADEVEGTRCYHSVRDIPGGVDGVVIVTRPQYTDQIVRDCVAAGVKRVWMHGGPHGPGTSVSEAAVKTCRENDITVIAGACPLMYGQTSDGFHRIVRSVMGLTGAFAKA